jgi:hypothetical protein
MHIYIYIYIGGKTCSHENQSWKCANLDSTISPQNQASISLSSPHAFSPFKASKSRLAWALKLLDITSKKLLDSSSHAAVLPKLLQQHSTNQPSIKKTASMGSTQVCLPITTELHTWTATPKHGRTRIPSNELGTTQEPKDFYRNT